MSEREKLKKLAEAATPGPWEANGSQWQVASTGQDFEGKKHHVSGNGYAIRDGLGAEPLADAEYIAAANPSTILALLSELEQAERERETFRKDAKTWEGSFRMYRDAWVRELGGWLIPKSHEIDALVLTTRKRCVNPLLGNCRLPHWLGKPTADGKALQQTPHPRDHECRDWKFQEDEAVANG